MNSIQEKRILKAAKSDYKAAMWKLFGPKWRMISRHLGIYNVPEDPKLREEAKQESLKYYK